MTTEEFYEKVEEALTMLEAVGVTPNTIWMPQKLYMQIKADSEVVMKPTDKPMLFGLNIEVADLPEGQNFIIGRKENIHYVE